jgi:hypothetical protein
MPTLADLFNQKSQDIYTKFSAREEPSSQPYISILPDSNDSRSRIKDDSRALPVVSTIRDTQRVSKFLRSSDGLLFLGKQALLQTGNTFENTKVINPLEFVGNTIPFLHIRRHLNVLDRTPGLLQVGTVNSIASKFTLTGTLNEGIRTRNLGKTVRSLAGAYISSRVGALTEQLKATVIPSTNRPEFTVFKQGTSYIGPTLFPPQPISQRGLPRLNITATLAALTKTAAKIAVRNTAIKVAQKVSFGKLFKNQTSLPLIQQFTEETQSFSFADQALKFKENFHTKNRNTPRLKSKFFSEKGLNEGYTGQNPADVTGQGAGSLKGLTELKDPYNFLKEVSGVYTSPTGYTKIQGSQNESITSAYYNSPDIVRFIFSSLDEQTVQFRALISTIKENVKPEFTEQRYVGRTERFVVYGGAKRSLSLNFNVVAFSKAEQDGMWKRINYLSGLAFPRGVQNGFMVPPLFKMSIGGLYENQPCYLESLDFDFLDESITFDVDKEVPYSVTVGMQLSILEKRSKFYDSPFYKIVEDIDTGTDTLTNKIRA